MTDMERPQISTHGEAARARGDLSMVSGTVPLTERVLTWLPGPRLLWILVWAILPVLVGGPLQRFFHQAVGSEDLIEGGFSAYANVVALWGISRLRRDVAAIQPRVSELTRGEYVDGRPFQAIGSVWGPVLLMSSMAVFYSVFGSLGVGITFIVTATLGFIAWLPIAVLVWVAAAVLLGLDRLGRVPLALTPFEVDRSLGLRPFGALAFTPLLIFAAAALPSFFFSGATDVEDAVVNIGVLLLIVSLLFASLARLRTQLLVAKAHHLAWARDLYTQTVEPVRSRGSLEALRAGAAELQAAESLERRAASIQGWPFDDGILRAIVAIVTSVSTAILARLILSQLNL